MIDIEEVRMPVSGRVKIKGLDKTIEKFEQLQKLADSLDGRQVKFDVGAAAREAEKVKAATDKATSSKQKQASAASRHLDEEMKVNQALEDQYRLLRRNEGKNSATALRATDKPGVQNLQLFSRNEDTGSLDLKEVRELTNVEGELGRRLASIKGQISNARTSQEKASFLPSLKSYTADLGVLAGRLKDLGLDATPVFDRITLAIGAAEAEQQKLRRSLKLEDEKREVAAFGQRFVKLKDDVATVRKQFAGDGLGLVGALDRAQVPLAKLKGEMALAGQIGSKEFNKVSAQLNQLGAESTRAKKKLAELDLQKKRTAAAESARDRLSDIKEDGRSGRAAAGRSPVDQLKATRQTLGQLQTAADGAEKEALALGVNGSREMRAFNREIDKTAASVQRLEAELRQSAAASKNVSAQLAAARSAGFAEKSSKTELLPGGGRRQRVELEKVDGKLKQTKVAVQEFDRAGNALNSTLSETDRQLASTGTRAQKVGKNFISNTIHVAAWAASVAILYGSLRILRETLGGVIETQRRSAVLGQVLRDDYRASDGAVRQLRDSVIQLAVAEGRGVDEAVDAATRFARLGLTRIQILEAVSVALRAANVAEIEASEAAEQLSAIMASFSLNVREAAGVLNNLNSVSNKFNTTNKDLLQGIARVGALAKESGLSFQELTAIIATGTGATGRKGAEFGNALKAIIVSLQNPSVQEKVQNLFDFDVKDNLGQIKEFDQTLGDLFVRYNQLNSAERQSLLATVGKKQQAARLAVVLNKYMTVQRNLVESLKDETVTHEENQKIRSTLQSQLQSLTSAFSGLALAQAEAFGDSSAAVLLAELVGAATKLLSALTPVAGVLNVVIGLVTLLGIRLAFSAVRTAAASKEDNLLANTKRALVGAFNSARGAVNNYSASLAVGSRGVGKSIRLYGALQAKLAGLANWATVAGARIPGVGFAIRGVGIAAKTALFAVGGLTGGLILMATQMFLIKGLKGVFTTQNRELEELRKKALGVSEALNKLVATAQRTRTLANMAKSIRLVVDSIDPQKARDFMRELVEADKLKGGGSTADAAKELRPFISGGVDPRSDQARAVLGKLEAEYIRQQVAANDKTRRQLAVMIPLKEKALQIEKDTLENLREGSVKRSEVAEKIKVQQDEVDELRRRLQDAWQQAIKLDEGMQRIVGGVNYVSQQQAAAQVSGVKEVAGALSELITPAGRAQDALRKTFELESQLETVRGRIALTGASFESRRRAVAGTPVSQSRAKFLREEIEASEQELDKLKKYLVGERNFKENFENPGLLDWFLGERPGDQARVDNIPRLDAEQGAIEQRIGELRKALRSIDPSEQNDLLQKLEAAETGEQEKVAAELERQIKLNKQKLELVSATNAELLRGLDLVAQQTQADFARLRVGADPSEQRRNEINGIQQAVALSSERQRALRLQYDQAKLEGDTVAKLIAERALREAAVADRQRGIQLDQLQLSERQRVASIEAEITNERRAQAEAASEALGFASREEQVRAAMLEAFRSGGGSLGEDDFAFLSGDVRQSAARFTPDLVPDAFRSDKLFDLQRERAGLGGADQLLAGIEASLGRIERNFSQNQPAARLDQGLVPAQQVVQLNVAAGAVNVMLAEPVKQMIAAVGDLVQARLGPELAAIRAEFAAATAAVAGGIGNLRGAAAE